MSAHSPKRQVPYAGILILLALLAGCFQPSGIPKADASPTESHQAFLWQHPYSELLVEVYFAPDQAPSDVALDTLRTTLEEVTGKVSIRIEKIPITEGPATESRGWTISDLRWVARTHSRNHLELSQFGYGPTAIFEIYSLSGGYQSDDGTYPGVEIDGRAFVFLNKIKATSVAYDTDFERFVLIHETGHALGLVNCGIPMQTPRERADSPCHSTNPESVMQSEPVIDISSSKISVAPRSFRFDVDDYADLAAFRASESTVKVQRS